MNDMDQNGSSLHELVFDSGSTFSGVVLLGFHRAVFPLRCRQASHHGRYGRTIMQPVLVSWLVLLVTLHLALCSLCFSARQADGFWPFWLKRFRPRSSSTTVVCLWLVLLVTMHFALCFLVVARPEVLGTMAGMDQKDSSAASFQRAVPAGHCCSSSTKSSTSLSWRTGFFPWSRLFCGPSRFLSARRQGGRYPCYAGRDRFPR